MLSIIGITFLRNNFDQFHHHLHKAFLDEKLALIKYDDKERRDGAQAKPR